MLLFLLTFIQKASEFSTSSEGRHYNPPDGLLYYLVLVSSSVVVVAVVIYTVKWFIWPEETSEDHIKRKILESETKQG